MAIFGILPQAVVADISECDALETHENRSGMFFAARTFAMKFGQSLAMLMFTSLAIIGAVKNAENANPNDITAGVPGMVIVGIVAVVFCVLGAVLLGFYNEKKIMKTIEKKEDE